MGDMSEYLTYVVDVRSRKHKSRISYESFGDIYSQIKFTKACSSKLIISLSRVVILRSKVKGV